MLKVERIPNKEARPWILRKHYAHRMPCVQFAFGLFDGRECVGVVTYGPPPTPAIKQAIFGGKWQERIYELNRLCVGTEARNAASRLVGGSLRVLPCPGCVVSYADGAQGHVGYIYQATNFLFTGTAQAHDCEFLIHGKSVHGRTLTARGITDHIAWAKRNNIQMRYPEPKNRYVYFIGNKNDRREMRAALRYPVLPYPKGETKRYDASAEIVTQLSLF